MMPMTTVPIGLCLVWMYVELDFSAPVGVSDGAEEEAESGQEVD